MRSTMALACLLASCASPQPTRGPMGSPIPALQEPEPYGTRPTSDPTAVQGLVGVSFFGNDLEFTRTDSMDPSSTVSNDLSTMPTIGFGAHYRLVGSPSALEAGLDGSLLFSWWRDSAKVVAAGGGTVVVKLTTSMLIGDIGFGVYGSQMLGESVRVYVAGGPLVQFGSGFFENELGDESEGGFGVGGYVRGGIEFRIKPGEMFGIGVRNTWSDLDFGGSVGDLDTDALQFFVTYTDGF